MNDAYPPAILLDAMALWIAAYRAGGNPAEDMLRTALEVFPEAQGSDYAVALIRANRARAGKHG